MLLDERFHETFLRNRFDQYLNNFQLIRRPADIYEWGNQVLWPGLFGEAGPSCGHVGAGGHFASWSVHAASGAGAGGSGEAGSGSAMDFKGGCNDDGWPDGEGAFGARGRRSWTMDDLVDNANQLDWGAGILIRQVRTKEVSRDFCGGSGIYGGDRCKPELNPPYDNESRESFGFNWTTTAGAP